MVLAIGRVVTCPAAPAGTTPVALRPHREAGRHDCTVTCQPTGAFSAAVTVMVADLDRAARVADGRKNHVGEARCARRDLGDVDRYRSADHEQRGPDQASGVPIVGCTVNSWPAWRTVTPMGYEIRASSQGTGFGRLLSAGCAECRNLALRARITRPNTVVKADSSLPARTSWRRTPPARAPAPRATRNGHQGRARRRMRRDPVPAQAGARSR